MSSEAKTVDAGYPEPTTADLEDPAFEAIWQAIKGWDVARDPNGDGLRSGPTGNDVMHILQQLRALGERSTPAAKAVDGWLKDLVNILDRLDHAETLHEDTMRFQYQYACDDLGAHLAMHREELRAALGIPAPPSPETNGEA